MQELETDPRYPIGRFAETEFSEANKQAWINDIKFLPQLLENSIQNLDEAQLNTPYREGGWTVKQLVHHVADSHMNAYMRIKLGLTENNPTIKTYDEKAWAELADTNNVPINISLTLLHSLHIRLHNLLANLAEGDFMKTIYHPEKQKNLYIWQLLATYSWHGRHHVAHITTLRDNMNWQ
jgi:hypothetical protein